MSDINEILNPRGAGQQDDFTEWMRSEGCFMGAKRLPDGSYAGFKRLLYTHAICLGVTPMSAYSRRFCYEDTASCLQSYAELQSREDTPTGWIARRPQIVERTP